jgi:hypothetical protein
VLTLFRLKCNREKPCQNCIVRGESNAASCSYAEKAEKKYPTKSNPRSDAEDMRKRLNRLENSILSMMSSDEKTTSPRKHSELLPKSGVHTIENPNQAGGQKISADTRSTHWDAILNDLGAMKDAWSEENDKIEFSTGSETPITKDHRPSLLSGLTQPPDRSTIVASLPPREAADKLVARFFESYNPASPARCKFIRFVRFRSALIVNRCSAQSHFPQTGIYIQRTCITSQRLTPLSTINTGLILQKPKLFGLAYYSVFFALPCSHTLEPMRFLLNIKERLLP